MSPAILLKFIAWVPIDKKQDVFSVTRFLCVKMVECVSIQNVYKMVEDVY